MVALWSRLLMTFALSGVLGSAAPRVQAAHCRSDDQPAASHHQHAGHHGAKDTGAAEQCPHCPPAECRRHAACDAPADSAITVATAVVPAPPAADRFRSAPADRADQRSQPPTPPPQSLL